MLLILPITFIAMYYYFYNQKKDEFEALVRAEILFHVCLLLITNSFSIFHSLTKYTVLAGWSIVLFLTVFFMVKNYGAQAIFVKPWKYGTEAAKGELWIKLMLLIMGVLSVVLLIGAIFTVPYNYDSMTYHLGRIAHWIDNQSVNHFISNIDRQIYSPVLSEYEMLHVMLLTGSDTFLNFVQYISMFVTALVLYRTALKLKIDKVFAMLSAFLFMTMPLTISQSITTQNDLLAAMWFAIFIYYFVDFIEMEKLTFDREQREKLVLIGAAVAFAFLTKTSVCASMLFFMPWLLVVCIRRKDSMAKITQSAVLAGGTLVALISETLIRTYISCGSLMADTTSANIMVATKNVKYIIVNICKNFSLLITQHIFRPLNGVVYRFAIRLGELLQVDFNNEAISYHGFDFLHHMNMGDDMYSHDKTPSALVTYLALLAGIVLLFAIVCVVVAKIRGKQSVVAAGGDGKNGIMPTESVGNVEIELEEIRGVRTKSENITENKWYQRINIGLCVSSWLSLGFIMALLRWQPWGTRLMYPALAMMVLMVANVLSALCKQEEQSTVGLGETKRKSLFASRADMRKAVFILPIILLGVVLCTASVSYNMQPAMENIKAGCEDRMSRYFRYNNRYTAYQQILAKTEELGCKKIGVSISGDGYDYPLWLMYQKETEDTLLYHVILDEDDVNEMDDRTDLPECILYVEHGTIEVGESRTYQGETYTCVYVSDINPDAPDAVLVRE